MTGPQPISGRLTIKENMTVDYVKQNGNTAQKAAICIFDEDGNGVFSKSEADRFNSTRITLLGDELRINKAKCQKGENPHIETVDLKKAQKKYAIKQEAEVIRKKAAKEYYRKLSDTHHEFESYDKNGNLVSFLKYAAEPGIYKTETVNDYDNKGRKIKIIYMVNDDVPFYDIITYSDLKQGKQTKIISYLGDGTLYSTSIREYDKEGKEIRFDTYNADGRKQVPTVY